MGRVLGEVVVGESWRTASSLQICWHLLEVILATLESGGTHRRQPRQMANCLEASGFFPIKLKSFCKMKAVEIYGNWLLIEVPQILFTWETGKSKLAIINLSHLLVLGDSQGTTQVSMRQNMSVCLSFGITTVSTSPCPFPIYCPRRSLLCHF